MKKILVYLYFGVLAVIALSVNVSAYLDPSTTTYLIQIIAGVFIAAGATAGIVWHKLKRTVKKKTSSEELKESNATDDEKDEDEAD